MTTNVNPWPDIYCCCVVQRQRFYLLACNPNVNHDFGLLEHEIDDEEQHKNGCKNEQIHACGWCA